MLPYLLKFTPRIRRRFSPVTSLAASLALHSDPSATEFIGQLKYSQNPTTQQSPSPSPSSWIHSPMPTYFSWTDSEVRDCLVRRLENFQCPEEAKDLHLQLLKYGFVGDVFLSNSLINLFARISDLESMQKLFDEMAERNEVTWSCVISGYAQQGMPCEACSLFCNMVREGFTPNRYAFGSALRACQEFRHDGILFGMQIHGLSSKTYAHDAAVNNALISMYSCCLPESSDYVWRVFQGTNGRNLVSWNSIISAYSQKGDVAGAFWLFSKMQYEVVEFGYKPNEYTFGSLISVSSCCCDSGPFLLEQMLAEVQKTGFLPDLYVGSALVSGFARLGLTDSARRIFEQMSVRNAVSLNGLMVGLVKQNRGAEAAEVFKEMKHLVNLNLDSYVVLLSAYADFKVPEEGIRKGRELHGYATRNGLIDLKVAIGNGFINMYAKCGDVQSASSVFRHMCDRDLVSWNSLISGLDQNNCYEEALEKFCQMRDGGLTPSNFALIGALSSCASLGWIGLGSQIHSEGLKLALDLDISVSNALLAMYAESKDLLQCRKLFNLMPGYDKISWNTVIGALAASETSVLESFSYFLKMMSLGWHLHRVTFVNVLSAVSSLSDHALATQIHTLVLKYSVADDTTIENALISCYGKCGEMKDCELIFDRMHERRDEVTWNSMVYGYIHNDHLSKAMDLVGFMMQSGNRLDLFTFATVLSACASVATLERGMEVHACQIRACLESDIVVGSALVDMYAKCGRIDYASKLFDLMYTKNVYTWNSMISAYARHGHAVEALETFGNMKLAKQPPDHVTFIGVLSACSHAGLVKEGLKQFESMSRDYGLEPKLEHFSCMIDMFGRAGDLEKVGKFINDMPINPNALIWRTVLGACARANRSNTELGRVASEKLLELEPDSGVNYVLLSNMYASGAKWENVALARSAMRLTSVKKEAGYSWVTMKDGVHVFVSGDKSHPEKDAIYEKLKELQMKIKDLGYVPQTSFALYDLEVESKEELLSYHSEKLAIAFVLTRKSISSTIRIMKNLRICGDCHTAFEYISKVVGHQIVLRDSNRFHHFADGKCSCGNYW